MSTLTLELDGALVTASEGETLLDVARREGRYVPTLCFDPRLAPFGACRVCLVGVKGARGPVPSCTTLVREGMVVDTRDPVAMRVSRGVVELVLSDFPLEALAGQDSRTELARVARHFGLTTSRYAGARHQVAADERHPYIRMEMAECISCARCVRICDEVQGAFALSMAGRGFDRRVVVGLSSGLLESSCVSCGACVSTCPTGALDEQHFRVTSRVDKEVHTTCGYCGVGCGLVARVSDGKLVSIEPALDGPSNQGHTCVKGRFAHAFVRSKERLTRPLIREGGRFREASWDEALGLVASRMQEIKRAYGPDALAALSSSRGTNEESYALQKLFRAVVGTHNIDNCSRVCHSPSSAGLIRALGLSGGTHSYADIDQARVLLVTGSNTTEAHPVVGARIKQAVLAGARLLVIDPRRIELSHLAEVYLQPKPGSNVALFSAMANVLVREQGVDRAFLDAHVEGVEAYLEYIGTCTPEWAEPLTGVRPDDVRRAARLYGAARPASILYGLGVTEHSHGTDGVLTLINLALLTGNLGPGGGGVNPLRGQNNVQGSSDSGALPNVFTMYQSVADAAVRERFERAWRVKLPAEPGLTSPKMLDAALAGKLRLLYIFGEDPAQTEPNTAHVRAALGKLDFLVVQEIFLSETAKLAHVVLPAASFLEKTGTFTNAERRVQLVQRAVDPPGEAREDLHILLEVAKRLGGDLGFATAAEAMDELAALTPALHGVSHARLGRSGLQWPVPTRDHPGTKVLYEQGFSTPSGRARLTPVPWKPPGDAPDEAFPLVLVTGRQLAHYNAGTMTRRTPNAELTGGDMLEVHPDDARALGISEGDEVELTSRRGTVRTFANVTTRVAPGNVFMSFHFPEVMANLLTGPAGDEVTGCPEYKVTAVKLTRVGKGDARAPRWAVGLRPGA